MLRRLLALVLLSGAAIAQQPPTCTGLAVSLKASKQVAPGRMATATFTVKNTGGSTVGPFDVSLSTPGHFAAPHVATVRPKPKPTPTKTYSAPTTLWTGVQLAPRKSLRFTVKAKMNSCNPNVTSVAFTAAAYQMSGSTIQCLSAAPAANANVKLPAPKNTKIAPCPTPAPGPAGTVLFAENQAFSGATDARRLAETTGRKLSTQPSLEACASICNEEVGPAPFFAVYNDGTGACSCCKDASSCGAMVYSPGTNIYEIPPGTNPTPSMTKCGSGLNCAGGNEFSEIERPEDCMSMCTTDSPNNKFFTYSDVFKVCMCEDVIVECIPDENWETYAYNGGVCPSLQG